MTPEQMIADLDTALEYGETIKIRRRVGASAAFVDVSCRARISGMDSEVLVSGVKQIASMVIISPTQIKAAVAATTWPGLAGGSPWPRVGDFIQQAVGGDRKIEAVVPVIIKDTVVRIEARVLG
jgi:hypothetical protein